MVYAESQKTRSIYLTKNEVSSQTETLSRQDVVRFWAKVQKADAGCWIWTASRFSNGYGQFAALVGYKRQRTLLAHRVAYALSHGPVPVGAHILHSCDTPACVNPAHLSAGDHLANMRDASAKGRLSVPRPKRQKVTDAQLDEMRALAAAGVLHYVIANRFGVSRTFVSLLLKGKRRQLSSAKKVAA